ncbi:MAG: FAD-dependent oxidoreductase [Spirochaetales bacterium]|jgi:hypothetical protein|nr:FAD-dependent oxidoreductase [Spirochaetales bacterium]
MTDNITYNPGNVPVYGSYDLVVCGGGPAGITAALAAKRSGLHVLLIEGQGQLGGMGTSGLVSHWLGGRTDDCKHWVVGGIFKELSEEGAEQGFALLPHPEPGAGYSPFGWNKDTGGQLTAGVPFDPFEMASYLDQKLIGEGVEILFMTQIVDVVIDESLITHVLIFNKSGLQAVSAPMFVDSTGDADIAVKSGCETEIGRSEDRLMTPVTLQVHMDGIDQDALAKYINDYDSFRFLPEIEKMRKEGTWPFIYDRLITVQLAEKGTMMVNTPRIIGIDGTDGTSITKGMIQGRKEIFELRDVMRKYFPGCANARVRAVAPLLGVRETRRIRGDYQLTVEDLGEGKDFPDTIGFSAYGWDLPDPKLPSHNPSGGDRKRKITPVPYRTLLPRPITNLIMAGRSLSVERPVLGPLREMAVCMGMGEAAGVAAGLAKMNGLNFHTVDIHELRSQLRGKGAVVDYEEAWE